MSEKLGETVNTSDRDFHSDSNHLLDPLKMSRDDYKHRLFVLHKKARLVHARASSGEASLNNISNADADTMNSSTAHSSDSKAPENLQSSRVGSHLKAGSVTHTLSEEYVAEGLHDVSKDAPPNDKGRKPSASTTYYARYRQTSADLMTRHMFSGKKVGKRVLYYPVYKRNRHGKLLKLKEIRSRHWNYVELSELSEEEIEGGLKLMEEPETDVVS